MGSKNFNRRDFLKLLNLLPLAFVQPPDFMTPSPKAEGEQFPNILILVFDALSATNMSLHGYPRQTTPNLDRIANEATVFNRHYAGGNWTPSGTGSLLTGSYPWSHRALHMYATVNQTYQERNLFGAFQKQYQTFSYSHNTLANVLLNQFKNHIDDFRRRDELSLYSHTYFDSVSDKDFSAFSNAETTILFKEFRTSSLILSRFHRTKFAFIQSVLEDRYAKIFPRGLPNSVWNYFTIEDAIEWVKAQVTKQQHPFLGYVHLFPPHSPYNTRHDFVDIFSDGWRPEKKPESIFSEGVKDDELNRLRQHYDEYIAYVDSEFGRLFEYLKSSGTLNNTYLIFTSDHGEMFERGIWEHTTPTLYEPIIRIPLIIWSPEQKQRIDIDTPTSCVDLLPTLLHITGQPIPDWCEGQVLPSFHNYTYRPNRSVFTVQARKNAKQAPLQKATIAHIKGAYKLVYYFGYDGSEDFIELYNIKKDPNELNEISGSHSAIAKDLRSELMEQVRKADANLSG